MDVKKLAKELCNKSGCHHKCKDIDECVVMEEAEELLINQDKSNNFDVKSNEELFKQALVEGLNRRFDREIEEATKIEQIEEIAKTLKDYTKEKHIMASSVILEDYAEALYNAGYRKQSEDTVEVVRCKYCKYYNENEFTYEGDGYGRCDHPQQVFECECYDMWVETTPDDYCSYGEMKGGE